MVALPAEVRGRGHDRAAQQPTSPAATATIRLRDRRRLAALRLAGYFVEADQSQPGPNHSSVEGLPTSALSWGRRNCSSYCRTRAQLAVSPTTVLLSLAVSVKRPMTGHLRNVRQSCTEDAKPGIMIVGRKSGPTACHVSGTLGSAI